MCRMQRSVILSLMAVALIWIAPAIVTAAPQGLRNKATIWTPRETTPQTGTPQPVSQGPLSVVPINVSSWTPIGPAPLAAGGSNGNVSGRITGIAAHPTDPNTIYVAAAGGGVWKTINGGTSWTPLTDAQATVSMGAIAIGTNNPSMIYAGTGEANNSADSNSGRGILVSTDAGATWTLRTGPGGIFNTNRLTTSQIAVDPTDANIAYAAMADFGVNGNGSGTGIFKTTDGGATWVNMTLANAPPLESTSPWSAVAVDPNAPLTVYAAVGNPFAGISVSNATNGVYKSTNGGTSWTLLTGTGAPRGTTTGRFAIAISKVGTSTLYVSVSDPNTFATLSVVSSTNGGTSFTTVTPANFMGGQGWYDTTIAVDPANSAIVYVAGASGTSSMLRSPDAGVTWADISTGSTGTSPHVDHHGAAFDANGKFLDGDDGGIYRLDTPTAPISWSNLNGNLQTIQFQGIGLHPTDPNKAIGGSQDNGIEIFTGSVLWTETD
jgi:hypothetical protein